MRRAPQSSACKIIRCETSNDCCESFGCVELIGNETVSGLLRRPRAQDGSKSLTACWSDLLADLCGYMSGPRSNLLETRHFYVHSRCMVWRWHVICGPLKLNLLCQNVISLQ